MRRCAEAIARAVVEFLDAVILACLRSCFGARPRRGGSGRRDELLVRGDRAEEIIWDDEEGLVRGGRFHEDLAHGAGIDEELRREASYLKLCGTISDTPAELRNEQSYENNLENANECDNNPTSGPPANCKLLFEANSSEGCEECHSLKSELNTEDAGHHHGLEFVPHSASSEKRLFQSVQHRPLDSGGSPFLTPLVIRDDIETPGTAYASHRGTSGKRVRIRKQFVYPVLRSIENRLQQTELTEDFSPLASTNNPLKVTNLEADATKDPTQRSSTSVVKSGLSESPSSYSVPHANASYEVKEALLLSPNEFLDGEELPKSNSDEKNAALSLSHWLKSSSADAENQGDVKCPAGDQSSDDCSFVAEKLVFMASDVKLDTDTPRLPKAWNGNGIPNTTTRYKEDQRVNWHTTPFEQRLLKVLSDEDRCPQRKVVRGKLFHLEEGAE